MCLSTGVYIYSRGPQTVREGNIILRIRSLVCKVVRIITKEESKQARGYLNIYAYVLVCLQTTEDGELASPLG